MPSLNDRLKVAVDTARDLRWRVIYHAKQGNPAPKLRRSYERWKGEVASLRRQLRNKAPKIIRGVVLPSNNFGSIGDVWRATGHYTAGPVDRDDAHAVQLAKSFDRYHRSLGWGGIGYHYMIAASGSLIILRPTGWKGAHTASNNSGNIGIVCNGTTGDRPTRAQARTLRWLLANAHTKALPASHRVNLRGVVLKGHKDWPGQSTACPGGFHAMYLSRGAKR